MKQYKEVYVCGKSIMLFDREVRAPLCVLTRCTREWPVPVIAHRTSGGEHWFARQFSTLKEARKCFAAIVARYPHAISTREYIRRERGQAM